MFGLLKNKLKDFASNLKEKVFAKKEEIIKKEEIVEEKVPVSLEKPFKEVEEKPEIEIFEKTVSEEKEPEIKEKELKESEEAFPEKEHITGEELVKEKELIEEFVEEPIEEGEELSEEEKKIIEEVEQEVELEGEKEEKEKEREEEQREKEKREKKIEEKIVPKPIIKEKPIEKTVEEKFVEKHVLEKELPKKPSIEKRELKAKVSAFGKLKSVFKKYVELSESDLSGLLSDLELALLESDVNQDSAEAICKRIKNDLLGKKIPKGEDFDSFIQQEIKKILSELMQTEKIDLLERIFEKKEKPFVILFLGPNGAGKTTSIAKLTAYLQKYNLSIIWSASDTFRAASIEQLETHAQKLNVRVVKHKYGADPAAVAFDAVNAAKAKNIDVVLIDSAGRQETNKNLMEELKKLNRVSKPDLKIFVGEALAGKAFLEQAKTYNEFLSIDGFILTKIDTDTKGGTSISLLHELKKPILFIGTGQHYNDFQEFTPEYILERVI